MATITTLNPTDNGATSRTTINGNFTTLNPTGDVVGTTDTQTLTNKTIVEANNTLTMPLRAKTNDNNQLIQYGQASVSVTSTGQFKEASVTLPTTYDSATYYCAVTPADYSTGAITIRDVRIKSSRTSSSFVITFTCDAFGATTTVYFDWITIGTKA